MANSSAKLSVSVPLELERDELGAFLAQLDEKHGPASQADVAEARSNWPKR